VSSPDPLTCGYSSCLTPCHRVFVSNSCHFFRSPRTFSTAVHTAVRIGATQRLGCEPLCHGDERGPTPSLPASTSTRILPGKNPTGQLTPINPRRDHQGLAERRL